MSHSPYLETRIPMYFPLARDHGPVLRCGEGPSQCDILNARDPWVWEHQGTYYLHYDAAGPRGWLGALATSTDLVHWKKHGPYIDFGGEGSNDSAAACYGVTYHEAGRWHMFYIGTWKATPAPDLVPHPPYYTLKAEADSPRGPWRKRYDITPFTLSPDPASYYGLTASSGHVIRRGGEYLMFFSASRYDPTPGLEIRPIQRTLGIARTDDLEKTWRVDPEPILPLSEQIENSSLYYEPGCQTWFLFTNHVGHNTQGREYCDAIWVYWSKDLNHWDAGDKAVVLDGRNCNWSRQCVGLPSVLKVGDRLAIFYDAPGGESISHMRRDIGLAWLELPMQPGRRP